MLINICEDSMATSSIGCIDIYTPPMFDSLYLGSYMKGDFIESCSMELIKSYFDCKVHFIIAYKRKNHIDYLIYLRGED